MRKLYCMLDLWLFEELAPEERRQLEPLTRKLVYTRGQRLFTEGDPASVVLLVTSGRDKALQGLKRREGSHFGIPGGS